MSGRRLVLLRHGRTSWNLVQRAQGHADIELDEEGHRQAAEVAPHIAAMAPVALWTSDLARARQTSGYVERSTGLVASADERLREFDVGDRQGLTSSEFEATYPAEYAAWRAGLDHPRVPGAESDAEVAARMMPAIEELRETLAAGETGVVVTHGACMKVAIAALLGWPLEHAGTLQGIPNCSWVALAERHFGDRLRLASYNESPIRADLAGLATIPWLPGRSVDY